MSTIDKLAWCLENADGWVVRNLRREYNSVFPSELIHCEEDLLRWELVLSIIMKEHVTIRQSGDGYICEM